MPNLVLDGEQLATLDRFSYLGSCVTKASSTVLKVNRHISKSKGMSWSEAFVVPIWYSVEVEELCVLYRGALSSVVWWRGTDFYAKDVRRLEIFDHRHFCSVAWTEWNNHMKNVQVSNRILDTGSKNIFLYGSKLDKLRLCNHLLRLPYRALFSVFISKWNKSRRGPRIA